MSELSEFRKAKDEFFRRDPHAPLTPEQQQRFRGLDYYPENPGLVFELSVEEVPGGSKESVQIETSTGDTAEFLRWGRLNFTVGDESACLAIYRADDGDDFFLPFMDATKGKGTYGGGRYLELLSLPDGKVRLDFNYAYNPYCAYNPQWSCPIPPPENRLTVAIEAGEKAYTDAGHASS